MNKVLKVIDKDDDSITFSDEWFVTDDIIEDIEYGFRLKLGERHPILKNIFKLEERTPIGKGCKVIKIRHVL